MFRTYGMPAEAGDKSRPARGEEISMNGTKQPFLSICRISSPPVWTYVHLEHCFVCVKSLSSGTSSIDLNLGSISGNLLNYWELDCVYKLYIIYACLLL